jgi:hypothetical protein
MSALRGAGLMAFVLGVMPKFVGASDCGPGCTAARDSSSRWSTGLVAVGASAFIGGTIYDVWDAHNSARRTNERARQIAIVPMLDHSAAGNTAGLALTGSW